eukprot:390609_1
MSTAKLLENNSQEEEKLNTNYVGINAAPRKKTKDGIRLEWDDIKLEIKSRNKNEPNIPILRGISGCARPGELYAIIGASGGGKTTLLSILTGRIRTIASLASNSICSGIVTMNNITVNTSLPQEFNYLSKNVAFVMQNDLLFPTEKCGEAIKVSALLRLHSKSRSIKLTKQQKLNFANQVLEDLDLKKCENTYIGSEELRGLSGGERTRTSIGIELVTNPNIVIADEPTSGLDSASAYSTMLLLKKLANKGKTVMACIHQPSSEIFDVIDRILILAKGKVVYEGAVKPDLYEYLKGINYECPHFTNIADYVIQQINKNSEYFIDAWVEHKKKMDEEAGNLPKLTRPTSTASEMGEIEPKAMIPLYEQLGILIKRQCKIFIRDKSATYIRLLQILFVAILMGLIWWRLKSADDDTNWETNLQNRFGALFLAMSYTVMNAISASNQVFPGQRLIFEKERSGNWYYSTPWIFAKFCIDIPWTCLIIIPLTVLTKYMINLHLSLFWYYFIMILIALSSDSLGFFIGCLAPSTKIASQMLPLVITPLMLFSGFFIDINTVPQWLRWIKWIDVYYYGVEVLCIEEFNNVGPKIAPDNEHAGNVFLDRYNMDPSNKWRDIYMLLILFGAFRLFSIVWLLWKNGR